MSVDPAPLRLSLVAALSRNRVIGREGGLPWHLPDDLARFKALTTGHTVVMGRRTFESIGRPLPRRRNVVLTRRTDLPAGVEVVGSLDAIRPDEGETELFIIGGEAVFEAAMPRARRLCLTVVDADVAGDRFFPAVSPLQWERVESVHHPPDDRHALPFHFETYHRRP